MLVFNLFAAMLATQKTTNKSTKFETIKFYFFPSHEHLEGFLSKHSVENRFVTEPSDILSGGVYVCTFQPGNFTGWGSEGVDVMAHLVSSKTCRCLML